MRSAGMSRRSLQAALGTQYNGDALFESGLSRARASQVATAVQSEELYRLAESDVYWDAVSTVEADGVEDVFDITVDGVHNFIVEDIIVHNSIEQDADVVLFLYRPGMHKDDIDRSVTELLVEKNRNGPTTKIDLHFQANQMVFYEAGPGVTGGRGAHRPRPPARRHGPPGRDRHPEGGGSPAPVTTPGMQTPAPPGL